MKLITEGGWSGWNPSAGDKGLIKNNTLLRADNLDFTETGVVRLVRGPRTEAKGISGDGSFGDIKSIYSTKLMNVIAGTLPVTVRYLFEGNIIRRNSSVPYQIDAALASNLTASRAAFLSILNHVFVICGSTKLKDRGDYLYNLGLPAPSAPTLTVNAIPSKDLNNLNAGQYTNWNIKGAGYGTVTSNAADVTFTPDASTLRACIRTVFAGTVDATDLGGTGNDTPDDVFSFNFRIDNLDKLDVVVINLYNEDPATTTLNYFYKQWNFNGSLSTTQNYGPFPTSSDVLGVVELTRGNAINDGNDNLDNSWIHVGVDSTKNWTNIKAIEVFVKCLDSTATIHFNGFNVKGGKQSVLNGAYSYVAVQAFDTGSYVEMSPASAPVSAANLTAGNVTVTPAGAIDAHANQYLLFRNDPETGVYLLVQKQTGALGFAPAAFLDVTSVATIETAAAVNPNFNILQFNRTALPNTIVDMIWFRDRVIYLTNSSFIPSFILDPGSYDSRYVYEIAGAGGNSETCLFIVKLDVGTFIVATTKDFYRVTGTFALITDPVSGAQIQDVNIYSLGISDPAISHVYCEYQGSIIYLSSTGIRSLTNATSTLLNGNLDPLFRKEARYGLSPISLIPNDQMQAACSTSGNRIIWSLPCFDGINRVFVLTLDASGGPTWRLWNAGDVPFNGPTAMCREEDGTIIYGSNKSSTNVVKSFETLKTLMPVKLKTAFNYGDNPFCRKDAMTFKAMVNTGGRNAILRIAGLRLDGNETQVLVSFSSDEDAILELDLSSKLEPCVAFAVEIGSYTDYFTMKYYALEYEERPVGTRRVLFRSTNFDSSGRKRIGTWAFVADPINTTIHATVRADNVAQPDQNFTGADIIKTFTWNCNPATDLLAVDWEIELTSDEEFEFFKFLPPDINETTPNMSNQELDPYNNFGTAARKSFSNIPFKLNDRGNPFTITLKTDGVVQTPINYMGAGDKIRTINLEPTYGLSGVDWERRITSTNGVEFYGWLEPTPLEQFPIKVLYAKQPATNLGVSARKMLGTIPFQINPLGNSFTFNCIVDGIVQTPKVFNGLQNRITTLNYYPPNGLSGVDWEWNIQSTNEIEFYKWLEPNITERFPVRTKYVIIPYTNFGKDNPKRIANWPLIINTLGTYVTVVVSIDGVAQHVQTMVNNYIETMFWRETLDLIGVDWQMEIYSDNEFEFYKALAPDILQILPVGKTFDQVGPLDLNAEGTVFGARFRIQNTGGNFHYKVLDNDVIVYENSVATDINQDSTYIEIFPKGISTTTCRMIMTSDTKFYRFSVEFKVRMTGKETEHKYMMVEDRSAT